MRDEDLLACLSGDGPAAFGTVALTDARVQHPKIIVNLRDGADGGARVSSGGLLLNADRGRQAGEIIDIRLLQLTEELTRVTGQRLDVAPLPFGVKRVESQGAFPRTADAGENDELIAGQIEVDVAEIVLACAANDDGVVIHNR